MSFHVAAVLHFAGRATHQGSCDSPKTKSAHQRRRFRWRLKYGRSVYRRARPHRPTFTVADRVSGRICGLFWTLRTSPVQVSEMAVYHSVHDRIRSIGRAHSNSPLQPGCSAVLSQASRGRALLGSGTSLRPAPTTDLREHRTRRKKRAGRSRCDHPTA
jgi:hypothetical protein